MELNSFFCCIISFLYIKPQRISTPVNFVFVVLYRFSTSNHNWRWSFLSLVFVVLYRFSTSNHNGCRFWQIPLCVVLYRFSTSNHNRVNTIFFVQMLYYIVSLHQTTTVAALFRSTLSCIISFLYIKPQLGWNSNKMSDSCIISFLYIKPQLYKFVKIAALGCIISFLYIKPQPLGATNTK